MTITVTSIGANTAQITASGTNTLANLTDAVAAAMAGTAPTMTTGWALHDSTYLNASGLSTSTLTQVFKSLNVDTVTYKYVILRWDPVRQEVNTSCCETWNATTHVPGNECYTYFNCAPINYNLTACDFIVCAAPRWTVFKSYLNGEQSLWAGVFEMAREDPVDTGAAGLPCFGWISSNLHLLGANSYNAKPLNSNDHTLICLPRTKLGSTGIAAAKGFACDYGLAQVPNWLFPSALSMAYYLGTGSLKFQYTNWDTSRREVLPMKPIADYSSIVTNYGQIYGLKYLSPAGNDMNKIKVLVDSNGNADAGGTLKDHWLLNNHYKTQAFNLANSFLNTSWSQAPVTVSSGFRIEQLVVTGANYYCLSPNSNSLFKVNSSTNQTTVISLTGSPALYDLKYDGEAYVYIATANGVARLAIADDTLTYAAISGGVSTIAIGATAVFASPYSATTSPVITKILRSTFLIESGTVGSFSSGTTTLSSFTEAVRLVEATADLDGNVYFAPCVQTGANFKLAKITPTGVVSYLSVGLTFITWQVGLYVLDNGNLYVQQRNTDTAIYSTQVSVSGFTVVGSSTYNTGITGSAVTASNSGYNTKLTSCKISGVLITMGRNSIASVYSAWAVSLGNAITSYLATPVTWNDLQTQGASMGACALNAAIWSDGGRIITNTDTGIKVWGKVQGDFHSSGLQLGQMAIPV